MIRFNGSMYVAACLSVSYPALATQGAGEPVAVTTPGDSAADFKAAMERNKRLKQQVDAAERPAREQAEAIARAREEQEWQEKKKEDLAQAQARDAKQRNPERESAKARQQELEAHRKQAQAQRDALPFREQKETSAKPGTQFNSKGRTVKVVGVKKAREAAARDARLDAMKKPN